MKKQINKATGEVEYSQCEVCGLIANFDIDECPDCKK